MSLYDLNKSLTVAIRNGFIFNQIIKVTIKFDSILSILKMFCYLKQRILMCHRQFLKIISPNKEYVKRFRNDKTNPFQFAIRQWFNTNMNGDTMIESYLIL